MRTPGFEMRSAKRADAAAVAAIETLCFSVPWNFDDILSELADNALARYIVCEEEGRVVAYAGLWAVEDEGHIMNLAVHPNFRGRGLGAAVLGTLLERTRREGLAAFTLEVRASNTAALRLYRRAGFLEEGRRRAYYVKPTEDAVVMWLR
jgi:ribosomal-protein-alanine N-acetyltransferase